MATALTGGLPAFLTALTGWKGYLLAISGALGIAGMSSSAFFQDSQPGDEPGYRAVPTAKPDYQTDAALRERGLRARPVDSTEPGDVSSAPWKDPLMRVAASRIGLSFFLALLVGTLLRVFLRGMLTVLVLASVLVAVLLHYDIIDPFWMTDSSFYQESADWVKGQSQSVKDLVQAHAPSGFASAAGLFLGLRR